MPRHRPHDTRSRIRYLRNKIQRYLRMFERLHFPHNQIGRQTIIDLLRNMIGTINNTLSHRYSRSLMRNRLNYHHSVWLSSRRTYDEFI